MKTRDSRLRLFARSSALGDFFNSKTCARNVALDVSRPRESVATSSRLRSLMEFLQTNPNIESLEIDWIGGYDAEVKRWNTLWNEILAAAYSNLAIKSLGLGIVFYGQGLINVEEVIQILHEAPSLIKKLEVSQFDDEIVSEEVANRIGNAIASNSSIQELVLSIQGGLLSTTMEAMSQAHFPRLKKVRINVDAEGQDQVNLSMVALGRFLQSESAPCLKELEVFYPDGASVSAEAMKEFVDGLSTNTSIQTLCLRMGGEGELDGGFHLSTYLLNCSLQHLRILFGPIKGSNIGRLIPGATKVGKLSLYDRLESEAFYWPVSVQCLELWSGPVLSVDTALIGRIMDALSGCPNLLSLKLYLLLANYDTAVDITNLLDMVVVPAGPRTGLEEFTLHMGSQSTVLTEESISALSGVLHSPHCQLKQLEVSHPLEDAHILRLISGTKASPSLQHLCLLSSGNANLDTWLSLSTSLESLPLKTITLDLGCNSDIQGAVEAKVLDEIKLNKHLEYASFPSLGATAKENKPNSEAPQYQLLN